MSKISTFSRALCLASFAAYGPVVAMAVLPATPVIAAQTALESAIALHDAGRAGDKAATEQAVAAFLDLMKAEPGRLRWQRLQSLGDVLDGKRPAGGGCQRAV